MSTDQIVTLIVAFMGILGTGLVGAFLSPVISYRMEVRRLRLQQSIKEREQQVALTRKLNEISYQPVKNWVIQVMKALDPGPSALRPPMVSPMKPDEVTAEQKFLPGLAESAAEVRVLANSDQQLAELLQAFTDTLENWRREPEPDLINQAHSAAGAVVKRIHQLMIGLPEPS